MRRLSNSPRAKEKRRIYAIGCEWAKAPGVCEMTGLRTDPSELHVHHILTKSAHPALLLCPWNWWVLSPTAHNELHEKGPNLARITVETRLPGLMEKLPFMERMWSKKPLGEIEELLGELPTRDVFVRQEMGLI